MNEINSKEKFAELLEFFDKEFEEVQRMKNKKISSRRNEKVQEVFWEKPKSQDD